ncbi:LamG-like jellyroll fold domain-containing protein [Lacinutrix mariniflava]|uniref:LamG-like jellyroll fold domain-containing protein n=1 Tax=Lacinutrix mariniflava TaxID=342955 RepID=UPI0006E3CA29|nr:LamG-like jellyroll fold domain-containing protein [Lacinutrix mariniflava]
MKLKLYFFLLACVSLNMAKAQSYDHVYDKVIGIYQESNWVSGQEYEIENFSNFSKCHNNISVGYTFNLEAGRYGTVNMYVVNSSGENLVNSISVTNNPISGTFTIPVGLLPVDQFLIKWQIGNTTSSNFIYENFTFTVTSPEASMPTVPLVENVYYSVGEAATALFANGSNLKWYTSNSGGMPITTAPVPSTNANGVTTYWVTQSDAAGCESKREPLNVYVGELATHLNFDGVNDYVQVPSGINVENISFTVEFYSKRASNNTDSYVLTQGNEANSNLLHIGFRNNNDFTFAFWDNDINIPAANYVADNEWHHWSCVYNITDNSREVYQDGVLVGSDSGVVPYTGSGILQIGAKNSNQYLFNGDLDDIRIWDVAKTADQINAGKNCELQGNETGLIAYYKFNQGLDANDNTSVTILTDATSNANNGTLTNFALTGTTSNWISGSPVATGSIIPSEATVTTPVTYTQGDIATPLTATTGSNGTGLMWYTSETGGSGLSTAPSPSTATIGATSYWVSSSNANGCESKRTEMVVNVYAPATHLNFDGSNNYIQLANESNFDFTTEMTVELWVNSNVLPQQWDALVVKGDDSWRLHLNDSGTVNFTCSGITPTQEINSTTNINDGNWHHIAATLGGNAIKIYIDGILETQATASGIINNNAEIVLIGNNSIYPDRLFTGNMDDIRIWSVAKTANQINAGKNCELQGNETGLVAYYNFNQGIDAADNTSETTLLDATSNANNGTLTNFYLTGMTSNWLAGSPVTTGSIIPSEATVTTPVTYNQGDTASQLTATTGSNGTGLMWYTTEIGGMGDVNAPTPDTSTVGSTSYWVTSTNDNGCGSERSEIIVNVEETLGINDNNKLSNISIYPNPTSRLLNISNIDGIELQLSIYDINGRLLLSKTCNQDVNTIDISSFSNGMYLLKMKTAFGEVTKRVIKD